MAPPAYMGQLALIIAAVIPPPASEPLSAIAPPLLELLLLDPPLLELLLLDPPDEELLLELLLLPLLELLLLELLLLELPPLDPPLLELLLLDPPLPEPPPPSPPVDELLSPLHPEKAPSASKANVALKPKAWEGFISFILCKGPANSRRLRVRYLLARV